MSVSNKNNMRFACFTSLIISIGCLVLGCSENPPDERAGESPIKETDNTINEEAVRFEDQEWFWRDRLSEKPGQSPLPECPEQLRQKADQILADLRASALGSEEEAAEKLAELGPSLLSYLHEQNSSDDRRIRWTAVTAACSINSSDSISMICHALHDEWNATAILASYYLCKVNEPWIITRLLKCLGPYPVDFNPHLMVRVKAAETLIDLGNYSGVPFLIKLLKDNTPAQDLNREWIENPRLAWEKDEAITILTRLTKDKFQFHVDSDLQHQADAAIAFDKWWLKNRDILWASAPNIEDPLLCAHIRSLVKGLPCFQARNADGARYCLLKLGPPVFPFLEEALSTGDFFERFESLDIISDLAYLAGDKAEIWAQTVCRSLKDDNASVRMKAAVALGALNQSSSILELEKSLVDQDLDVPLAAARAIGMIGGNKAVTILEALLKKEITSSLAMEAKVALVRISPKYDESFIKELSQDNVKVQELALQKLIDLFDKDFGYVPGAPESDRASAIEKIKEALKKFSRDPAPGN